MFTKNSKLAIAVIVFLAVLVSGSLPFSSATAGQWRLLSPTEYTANPASNMNGVFLINGGTSGKGSGNGWAVSDNGYIFFWDGFSWNQANTPTTCRLDAVNFGGPLNPLSNGVQTKSGWAVGGGTGPCVGANNAASLYWNGVGWTPYTVPSVGTAELLSVFLVRSASSTTDSVNAFAVGADGANGAFWQWNGVPGIATSWTQMLAPAAATGNPVKSVYMTHCTGSPCTGDDGIAVGNSGTIYRFVGGVWTSLPSPVATNLNGVAMSSQTRGWAVGDSCNIIQTTDGNTWTGPLSPGGCTQPLRSIVLLSSSEGWAVGDSDVNGVPAIVHGTSLDSSPVWTLIPSNQVTPTGIPSGVGLNSVTFATSGGNVWAVGASGVAAFCQNNCSSVSGAIWSTTTSPLTGNANVQLNSVFMDGDSDGWAVGAKGACAPAGCPALIRWNGYSWTQAPAVSPITTAPLFGVYMQGGSNAWAVGGTAGVASTLYYDGNSWTGRSVPACACVLNSVFMISGSESWAVGTAGLIMHSTTQGGSFTIAPNSGLTAALSTVFFDNSQSGWAGGISAGTPIIVHTTNDGADAWATTFLNPGGLPGGFTITSLFFQDFNHGWAAASGGASTKLLYWNGVSWTQVSPTTTNTDNLFGVSVEGGTPATDGWAVGIDTFTTKPVTIHYDGTSWTEMSLTPAVTPTTGGSFQSLFLRSSTNGLAVGTTVTGFATTSLALILHLDPPGGTSGGGGGSGGGTTTTASTTSTSVVTSTSMVTTSSTTSSASSVSSVSTSASTTSTPTLVSTAVMTSTIFNTPTSTTQAAVTSTASSVSVPLTMPPIPGFPLESIIAGIILGIAALVIVRRRSK